MIVNVTNLNANFKFAAQMKLKPCIRNNKSENFLLQKAQDSSSQLIKEPVINNLLDDSLELEENESMISSEQFSVESDHSYNPGNLDRRMSNATTDYV